MFFLLGVVILLFTILIVWLLRIPTLMFGGAENTVQIKELAAIHPTSELEREQYIYIYSDLSRVFRHKIFKMRSIKDIHLYIRSKLREEFDSADYEHGKQAYEHINMNYKIEPYNKSHTIQYLNISHMISMIIKPPRKFNDLINALLSDTKNIEYCDRSLYNMLNFWEQSLYEI